MTAPERKQVKQASLLAYVIAYLQEELDRFQAPGEEQKISDLNSPMDVGILIDDAMDAYEGGAR